MAHHIRGKSTELDIIRVASRMFLEEGYSKTTIRAIAAKLDISPGHLMFYFPTKEHLLAEVVDTLCDFQWKLIKRITDDGATQLMAICFVADELELYLDTHSEDKEAFTMYQTFLALKKEAHERYIKLAGPIMQEDMLCMDSYRWLDDPWPWDYQANVEV